MVFDTNPTDKEWRSIDLFRKKAEQLFQCELLKSGNNSIKAHIEAEKGKPVVFKIQLPNEDALKSLLLSFRPFYANDEASNFNRLLNILKRHCKNKDVHKSADAFASDWKHALFEGAVQFADKNGPITASRLFDLWFNGHYFHSDEDKDEELQSIKAILTEEYAKYMMVDAVYNCVKMINQIYNGIKPLVKPN